MKNLGSSCTTGPTKPGTASLRRSSLVVATLYKHRHQAAEVCRSSSSSDSLSISCRISSIGKRQQQGRLTGGQSRQHNVHKKQKKQQQRSPSVRQREERQQQQSLAWLVATSSAARATSSVSRGKKQRILLVAAAAAATQPAQRRQDRIRSSRNPSDRHFRNC